MLLITAVILSLYAKIVKVVCPLSFNVNNTAFRVSPVGKFGVRLEPRLLQEVVRDLDFWMDRALHLPAGLVHLAVVARLTGGTQHGEKVRSRRPTSDRYFV